VGGAYVHGRSVADASRHLLAQAALRFVDDLVADNADAAYATLTAASQQATRPAKLRHSLRQIIAPAGPLSEFRVAETYRIDVAFGQRSNRATCAPSARPEDQISVTVTSAPTQAYVIVAARSKTADWAFVLWLVREDGWRVQALNFGLTTLAGQSAKDTWRRARDERDRGHAFNAAVLYLAANQLVDRGPNFRLAIQPQIQGEMAKLQVPHELQGNPPFTWQFGEHTYKILQVGSIAVDGKIDISITQEVEPWPTDQEAGRRNRQLITEFARGL